MCVLSLQKRGMSAASAETVIDAVAFAVWRTLPVPDDVQGWDCDAVAAWARDTLAFTAVNCGKLRWAHIDGRALFLLSERRLLAAGLAPGEIAAVMEAVSNGVWHRPDGGLPTGDDVSNPIPPFVRRWSVDQVVDWAEDVVELGKEDRRHLRAAQVLDTMVCLQGAVVRN